MQTFLPLPSFKESIQCLDYKRLGKQRVEGQQLIKAITGGGGWSNHPCTRMWQNHVDALRVYTDMCIKEWVARGYNNTMTPYFDIGVVEMIETLIEKPSWFGNEEFHASHRSNLLRKDPEFYGKYNWSEPHDLEYIWPVG